MSTMARARYVREISQIERAYLLAAMAGTNPLILTVIDGAGGVDPDRLREAVGVATEANPGMAVTRHSKVWRGGGPVPPVSVLQPAGGGDPTEQDGEFGDPFFHRPVDVVNGPVAEVGIVPGAVPGGTRVVFKVSHVVADGRGLQHWMADVFRVLRGEEPVGAGSTLDDTHFVEVAGPSGDPAPAAAVTTFPSVLDADAPDPDASVPPRPLWVRRTVPAHASGMTARIAAAVSAHLRGEAGRMVVPVDLRRHDRSVRSTANLSAQLLFDLQRDDTWRRLHVEILGALKRNREVAVLGRDFRRTNPFANTLSDYNNLGGARYACTTIVSDHGKVDLDRFRAQGFAPQRFYTLPMLVPYAEMFISCCAVPEGVELTLACRRGERARAAAEAILDDIERLVRDGAASRPAISAVANPRSPS